MHRLTHSDNGLQPDSSESLAEHYVPVEALMLPDQLAPSSLFPNSLWKERGTQEELCCIHIPDRLLWSPGHEAHEAHVALESDVFFHALPS